MITIFKNIKDINSPNYITIDEALNRVKSGRSKTAIDGIRNAKDKKERSKFKQNLPSVCFSGKFSIPVKKKTKSGKEYVSCRDDESLSEHSGFVILDFDAVENLEQRKKELSEDEYSYAVWISPSGDGLKVLVKVPSNPLDHEAHYMALINKYPELDTTSKSLSRVCYESYDPEIYINKKSEVWIDKKYEEVKKPVKKEVNNTSQKSQGSRLPIDRVLDIVRDAVDGEKHAKLIKAGFLLGGFVASGEIDESEGVLALEREILSKGVDDEEAAKKAIADSVEAGKGDPVVDDQQTYSSNSALPKKKQSLGKLLSTESDEKEWLKLARKNAIPQGFDIGSTHFDRHFRLKTKTLVGIFGVDGAGKTTLHHFLAVCYSKRHHVNWLLICKENQTAAVRQKLMTLYAGKPLHKMNDVEYEEAHKFAYKYFDILENNVDINIDNFFEVLRECYSKKHYFTTFLDPYNAIQYDQTPNKNYTFIDKLREFSNEYNMAFHISMHISTEKARNWVYGDKDTLFDFNGNEIPVSGQPKIPRKNFVEGGQPIANKLDDIIISHRVMKIMELRNYTLIAVDKVKEEQTGGMVSYEEPIKFYKEYGFDSFLDSEKKNPLIPSTTPIITPAPEDYNSNLIIEPNLSFDYDSEEIDDFD